MKTVLLILIVIFTSCSKKEQSLILNNGSNKILEIEIDSNNYIFLKDYLNININTVLQIFPNLKSLDDDIYLLDLTKDNLEQFVIIMYYNDIINQIDYYVDFKDENLARERFDKYKNENLATELSVILVDNLYEYIWYSNSQTTHVRISKYDDIFSVKIGYIYTP